MKALSLTQPWATLVAIGAKKWETRSWSTNFRGQVAIHASKGYPGWARECEREGAFKNALISEERPLPVGSIIALATVVNCLSTISFGGPPRWSIPDSERAFGDFGVGRHAFLFEDVMKLPEPIPCSGALSFWTIPDDVLARIWTQLHELQKAGVA